MNCPARLLREISLRSTPQGVDEEVWYCIAACSMASSNAGSWLPALYSIACEGKTPVERRKILRRILESLLKSSLLFGIPRMLNAFYPLANLATKDTEMLALDDGAPVLSLRHSQEDFNPLHLTDRGLNYFRNIYREDTDRILEPMDRLAPDIRQHSVHLEYGSYMSELTILSRIETSQITLGALLPLDVPTQVKWHMRGLVRVGGTGEQVQYALDIAKELLEAARIVLQNPIPSTDVLDEERLFE